MAAQEHEVARIEAGIAAQEALRPVLGDDVVDTVVGTLRARLAELRARAAPDDPAAALAPLLPALGASLAPEVAARLRAVHRGEPERRPVAVLAVDLRAPAAALAAAPAAVRGSMADALVAELQAVVERHGPWPARLDDTVLVLVFGAPVVHEDDPARARRAALELRSRFDDLGLRWGAPAQVAAGVTAGVVTAGSGAGGYEVVGDPVDAAIALARGAPDGSVVLNDDPRRDGSDARGPFVGRARELAALSAVGEDLLQGRSHMVLVTGDGGLGKSRLVAEWRAASAPALRWIEGRGFAHTRAVAFGPVLDLLRNLVGGDDGGAASRDRADVLCAQLAPGAPGAPALVAHLLGLGLAPDEEALLARRSPQQVRQELVSFLQGALGRLARERPTVLLVEDLHWSDVTSLEVLETLVPLVRRMPLALVLLTRPGADAGRLIAAAERSGAALTRIGLAPLDAPAARAIVADRMGDVPPDRVDAVTRSALERAEGNPFFLEEIVRSLAAQGPIGAEPRGGPTAVPETPARVLQAQLDRLPPEARRLAQLASLLGRQFSEATLRAVAEDGDVEAPLRALEREGILRRRRGAAPAWFFRHALLLDASYESLVPERRRALHRRVGEALEGAEDPAVVGAHFARAELWDRAEEHLTRAGDAAFRLHAHAEARAHYRSALAALDRRADADARPRARVDLVIRYDDVSYLSDHPEVHLARLTAVLADLAELARRGDVDPGDGFRRCRALLAQGRLHSIAGDQRAARECFVAALAITEAVGDPALVAIPTACIGIVATLSGAFAEAERWLTRALGALDPAGAAGEFWYLAKAHLGMACAIVGRRDEGASHAWAVLSAARETNNTRLTAQGALTVGFVHLFSGEARESMALWAEASEAARVSGDRMLAKLALRFRAVAEGRLGEHERADATLAEAASAHHLAQERMFFDDWLRALEADVSLAAGRPAEALARAGEAQRVAEALGCPFSEGIARAVAGVALAASPSPDLAAAEARFRLGVELLDGCGAGPEAARLRRRWSDALG